MTPVEMAQLQAARTACLAAMNAARAAFETVEAIMMAADEHHEPTSNDWATFDVPEPTDHHTSGVAKHGSKKA
jgi:hypothetical protein